MGNRTFRYDLHVHTAEGSACAVSPATDIVDFFYREGYAGIVITDHFFTGSTTVPENLPWEERVYGLKQGYENAKKRGDEVGLDVFYSWEYTIPHCGTDFITLGLDTDWLLANPDVCEIDVREYMDRVHAAGGYIIHAHPFLEAYWIPYIRLLPRYVDAVEIINADCDFINAQAAAYAKAYGLTGTGGSDIHNVAQMALAGIEMPQRMESLGDLIESMKRHEHSVFSYIRSEKI